MAPAEAQGQAPHPGAWREAGVVGHVFTHFSLDPRVLTGAAGRGDETLIWTPRGEALAGVPSLFRKALELVPG